MSEQQKIVRVTFETTEPALVVADKTCVLLVSVGQKYHEDGRLAGTIELINKSNFKSVVIAVADTLQRHNLPSMSSQEAYEYSLKTGDEWLIRNAVTINKLQTDTKILRWDTALNNKYYVDIKEKIEKEYANNPVYKNAVNTTILTFTDRMKKRDENIDFNLSFTNCLKYLIEECPIIMPLWAAQGYDFIIYPKPMTSAMSMTREIFVKNIYPNKAAWLSLKFKKLGTPANQAQFLSKAEE
jgi:tRNA-dependent cyclodipeptide synthase